MRSLKVVKCLRHIEKLRRIQLRMIEEMYMGKSTEWSRQEFSPHLRVDFADIYLHMHMHIQHLNHVDHIFSSKHNSFSLCGILFSNCVILCFCNVCVFFLFSLLLLWLFLFSVAVRLLECMCVYEAFKFCNMQHRKCEYVFIFAFNFGKESKWTLWMGHSIYITCRPMRT